MKVNPQTILFFVSLTVFLACSDNEESVNTTLPSYLIAESEKLEIPIEVALPLPSGHTRIATYYAEGVQIYNAVQKSGTTEFEWQFVAPSASLYNDKNELIGTHFSGPSWQIEDHSHINAAQFSPAKTKKVSSESIDWLLLQVKPGTTPDGIFTGVTHIHRIATTGGLVPSTKPNSAGQTVGIPYTAVYRFIKVQP